MKRLLQKIIVVVFLLVTPFVFTGCQGKNDISKVSQVLNSIKIQAEFNETEKILSANQIISYTNYSSGPLESLSLQLYANAYREKAKFPVVAKGEKDKAYPNGISYGDIKILKVTINNENNSFVLAGEDDNILSIPLSKVLYPNEQVKIYLEYEVKLANIRHRLGYTEDNINLTHFYPVVCKLENNKFVELTYSANGDPFFSDLLNYEVSLTCGKNFVVAGSGKIINEVTNGDQKTTTFKQNAIRDFALVLSRKFKVETTSVGITTINYFYYKDENNTASLQAAKDAISVFSKLIGQYPYETFTVVQSAFNQGGMEYGTLVIISDEITEKEDYNNVIIHETAHQWWYNIVGNNQISAAWMDEGLTEYTTALFYKAMPNYGIDFNKLMKAVLERYVVYEEVYTSVGSKPDGIMEKSLNDFKTEPEYSMLVYVKGSLMFQNLNEVIGDKKFEKALRQYFKDNMFKVAIKENMIASFQKAAGCNLETFFDSWLTGKVSIVSLN